MENGGFQDYYKEVRDRDQRILENNPMPSAERINVWIVFGLSLGISTIVFSFFTKYSIILSVVALILSVIGYAQKKGNYAIAGIICSAVGLILGIILSLSGFIVISSVQEFWQNILQKIQS